MENRASFFNRLRPVTPPDRLLDVELAYTMAKFAHRAQTRSEADEYGKPLRYFEHPRRTALILMDEMGILDIEMIIAALLHDGLEDTRDLTAEMIEHTWGPEVARMVVLLSKRPKEGYEERLLSCDDWKVLALKGCDRLDNLRAMKAGQVSREFRARKKAETRELYFPVFEQLLALAPAEYGTGITRMVKEIHRRAE